MFSGSHLSTNLYFSFISLMILSLTLTQINCEKSFSISEWKNKDIGINEVIEPEDLLASDISFSGSPMTVSNNPESFTGTGWLFRNSEISGETRGTSNSPINEECNPIYIYHANAAGASRFLHLILSNPNSNEVTVTVKGEWLTNADSGVGKNSGPSFIVSDRWLRSNVNDLGSFSIPSGTANHITSISLSTSLLADGRFEVCFTDRSSTTDGLYVYIVATSDGSSTTAITASQTAQHAAGDIKPEIPGQTFGREAGIYSSSIISGTNRIEVPNTVGQSLGLTFNTVERQPPNHAWESGSIYNIQDSSSKSFGNYGHLLTQKYILENPATEGSIKVSISFCSTFRSDEDKPSFTWNGPLKLNDVIHNIWTTPTKPRQQIASYVLPAGESVEWNLSLFVPGLISVPQEVLFETEEVIPGYITAVIFASGVIGIGGGGFVYATQAKKKRDKKRLLLKKENQHQDNQESITTSTTTTLSDVTSSKKSSGNKQEKAKTSNGSKREKGRTSSGSKRSKRRASSGSKREKK